MSRRMVLFLTLLAMIAFAANSLLCRLALKNTRIDAATFTSVRLISGAIVLWLIVRMRGTTPFGSGSWLSAFTLFVYAAGFSFAYTSLPIGTGTLLLFGAVQATMIGHGLWVGERLRGRQTVGLMVAFAGLVGLLLPGLSTPPILSSGLMLGAGTAWGIYSLRGRSASEPIRTTADNFLRAVPFAVTLSVATAPRASLDSAGFWFAMASGALASGIGYAIWYTALKGLKATDAASVQLSVPILAAVGGLVFLGEPLKPRVLIAAIAILGGIALVILDRQPAK